MKTFNVYTGDGNDGLSFSHEIEASDLDSAVEDWKAGIDDPEARDMIEDDYLDEDGDENHASLTIYETPAGERAYNGGAYFCAEIWDAENDPRRSPR